ncbi:MAG: YbhN family protein [Cyanobacteria bacterium J06635_1]
MSIEPLIKSIKPLTNWLKPYLSWVIVGGTSFFVIKALKDHWQEVAALQVTAASWACFAIALGLTLLAHIWCGWAWHWILQTFDQSFSGIWGIQVYLRTNLAKYLPGNVWHFYGRVRAVQEKGASTGVAILSVAMEPLLMAAAALAIASVSSWDFWLLRLGVLIAVLLGVHPRLFNPVLKKMGQSKAKGLSKDRAGGESIQLRHYPVKPFLGELGFVGLRGAGFMFTVLALQPLTGSQLMPLLGGFSLAWLLGLVVPGAPGGIGVFEAVAIALLGSQFTAAPLLSSIAFYRLISTLAEVMGAGLIWLDSPTEPSDPLAIKPSVQSKR